MAMNLIPVIVVGGAILLSSKKKRRRITPKALPPANQGRGEIFKGDSPPDMIMNPVGKRFSVIFRELPGTGHMWELAASPPDNSIKLVMNEVEDISEDMATGQETNRAFVFEGTHAGEGSLVFHHVRPWMKGKEPPVEVVEIQTKIS